MDVVLGLLGDELDSLQDVGYVVDASLLDVQDLGGPVQIHHAVGRLGQQVQEALGGQVQRSVIPRLLRRGSRNWKEKEKGFKILLLTTLQSFFPRKTTALSCNVMFTFF